MSENTSESFTDTLAKNPIVIPDNPILNIVLQRDFEGTPYDAHDFNGLLLSNMLIKARTKVLAKKIEQEYDPQDTHLLCVLNGAKPFFDYLNSCFSKQYEHTDIQVGSYTGVTSGNVTITDINLSRLEGKRVLAIEDMVDTGKTAKKLEKRVLDAGALSFDMAAMLHKRTTRSNGYIPKFVGFEVPDEFFVGLGLNYNKVFRDLPDIYVISDKAKNKYK